MSDTSTVHRSRLRDGGRLRRLGAVAIVALALAGCGTNETGGSTGPGASANQAPAVSPAAELSGDAHRLGDGQRGRQPQHARRRVHGRRTPASTVNVTPVDWGQAVAKLQTGDRRQPDARREPDGHRHDGPVRGDRRPRARARELRPGARSSRAPGTRASSTGRVYGVPWYVETRLLYYRTDIAEKAGITAPPATWDELKAMAKAMKEKGGAEWGISLGTKNWQEYLPFLWSNGGDVIDAPGRLPAQQPAGGRGPDLLQVVLRRGAHARVRPRGLRHHAGVRLGHAPDVLLGAVASRPDQGCRRRGDRGQVGDRADAQEGQRDVVRRRQQPRRLQGQREQGRRVGLRPVPVRPGDPGRLVQRGHGAAGRPGRVGATPRSRTTRTSRMFGDAAPGHQGAARDRRPGPSSPPPSTRPSRS